jgi:periplasmic protein CpxP/Spy
MKLKLVAMFSLVIGLALVAVPLSVKALPIPSGPVFHAQNFAQSGPPGQPPNINLSDAQKQRLDEIDKQTKEKFDAILTSEQRQKLEEKVAQMKNRRGGMHGGFGGPGIPMPPPEGGNGPFADLNLSNDQKAKIEDIMQSSHEEVKSVFTDEQRQQLDKFHQNMPKRPPLR